MRSIPPMPPGLLSPNHRQHHQVFDLHSLDRRLCLYHQRPIPSIANLIAGDHHKPIGVTHNARECKRSLSGVGEHLCDG